MEQNLQSQTIPIPKSVKVKQNIAAWIFVLGNIYCLFLYIFKYVRFLDGMLFCAIEDAFVYLMHIIGWCFLLSIVANKATKIASITMLATNCLSIAIYCLALFIGNFPGHLCFIAIYVLDIYALSTIIRANNISRNDKTWVSLLIISEIITMISSIHNVIIYIYTIDWSYNYLVSISKYWTIIISILWLIGGYRLAKCAAFSGNYNTTPTPRKIYSPLNKYFAAILITAVVMCGLWCILYGNIEAIESILN